mgnify:CR=1 FL=1
MSRPEDRYRKLETKTLPNGRVVYKSAIPLVVEADSLSDISMVANERDRMDIIAHNVYGSAEDWWRIAAANKRVDGSLHLTPGQTVLIPKE